MTIPHSRSFAVLGQDSRLSAAAGVLAAAGWQQLPPAQLDRAAFLLLGTPTPSLDPWAGPLAAARPGTVLFAGAVARTARQTAAQLSLPVIDYMDSEELALFNAIPTAEGAIAILLAATPNTLWRARALLLGYGRIAQALVPRLLGFGARVTVAARSSAACARAALVGADTALISGRPDDAALSALAGQTDLLVNTVPQLLVTGPVLAALGRGAFVLDLAGAPGGVDLAAAAALDVAAQRAGGLPGKWAADAAGRAVGSTVLQFLQRHPSLAGDNGILPPEGGV